MCQSTNVVKVQQSELRVNVDTKEITDMNSNSHLIQLIWGFGSLGFHFSRSNQFNEYLLEGYLTKRILRDAQLLTSCNKVE